jgi:hypothetical protein
VTGQGFPCTEQGIRNAVAQGGGPHTFDCDGATTVVIERRISIDNDVVLDGEGNLTLDGPSDDFDTFHVANRYPMIAELRGFSFTGACTSIFVGSGGKLALTNSTVSGDIVARDGQNCSAIRNAGSMTVTDCQVSGNGVGIDNSDGGMTVADSMVSENSRGGIVNGGGVLRVRNSTVSGNQRHQGAGIDNSSNSNLGSVATLENSTVSGNIATQTGGGIHNGIANGDLVLINTTVSNNSAPYCGGINSGYAATLINSTVAGNTATQGSGICFGSTAMPPVETMTIKNTLVRDDCFTNAAIASEGYNVESPGDTCGFDRPTDEVNVSEDALKMGPLRDNGGPTETHALGESSIAIDLIPEEECVYPNGQPLTTDQRGEPRPEAGGTMCDVGAFERQPEDPEP